MRIALILSLCLWLCSPAIAQENPFRKHVDKLCSDELYGRGYVMKGDSLAADYIKSVFQKLELKPAFKESFYQEFSFEVNTFPKDLSLKLNGFKAVPGEDFIIDPDSPTMQGSRKTIQIGPKDIPLLAEGLSKKLGLKELAEKAVVIDTREADNDEYKVLRKLSKELMNFAPVVFINREKLTWAVGRKQTQYPRFIIAAESCPKKIKKVKFDLDARFFDNHTAYNVAASIDRPFTSKSIVFSAHYDHLGMMGPAIFPGANDNASGTALVLYLANQIKENNIAPNYDVHFVLFAGEEAGLLGSKHFVENPPFSLDSIDIVLNLDIMGTGDQGITVVNAEEQQRTFQALNKINREKGYLLKVKPRKQTANSDHYWFSQKGVPAVFIYTMGGLKHYHDIYDRAETLPLDHTIYVAQLLMDYIGKL